MADDKARRVNEDEKDEVEAHGNKKGNLANEEAKDEAAGDDDVEAHGKRANA